MILDGKVAIVTGGASGIGAGIARRFLRAGAAVTLFDIDGEAARRTLEDLSPEGAALAIQGDVASEEDVRGAVDQTVDRFRSLTLLINNAGMEIVGSVVDLTPEDWDRQIAVNLRGAFLFAKHAIPHMRRRRGTIVNIASVHAFVSYPGCAAYDASKAALVALPRTLALDHGRDGIRVNAICPGYVDTPLLQKWLGVHVTRMRVSKRARFFSLSLTAIYAVR